MKDNKDKLIKLFSEYADYQDEEIILNCLVIHEKILSDIKQLGHHISLGTQGCGKTHLLRYLSLPVQLKNPQIKEIDFLGIYFHLSQVSDLFLRVWKEKREEDVRLFKHYFTLLVLQRAIVEVEEHLKLKQEISGRIAERIAKLLKLKKEDTSLKDINGEIKRMQEEVYTFIKDSNTLSADGFDQPLFDDIKMYCQDIFEYILQEVRGQGIDGLQKMVSPKAVIFILIDGVECIDELAEVFAELLSFRSTYQSFFLKIGTRRIGDWIKRVEPRDYHLEKIEFSIFEPTKVIQNFKCIVNQRLKAYKEEYPDSKLESNIRRILGDCSEEHVGRAYNGFDNIALLSSGIPGTLFNILQKLFSEAWEREGSIGGIISAEVQRKVIERFSKDKYSEILSLGTVTNPNLYGLINGFFKRLRDEEIGLSRFVLEKSCDITKDEFNQIVNTLKDTIPTGILHTSDMINFELEPYKMITEVEFLPNCLLAPRFGVTFRHDRSLLYHLAMNKVLKWMKEGRKEKRGFYGTKREEPGQLSLFDKYPEPIFAPIFGGISYRKGGWEEKVRERLMESINKITKDMWSDFEGGPYLDAGEESPRGDIGMKSLELIKEAKTCVFEVTTSNPSVYSELGMALALLKPSIMIWNIEERPFDYQQIVDFLRSIEILQYKGTRRIYRLIKNEIINFGLRYNGKTKSAWFYDREPPFKIEKRDNTYTFLYGSKSGITLEIEERLLQKIYESFKVKSLEIPFEVKREGSLAEVCYKLGTAQHIIIETSFNEPGGFFMYGYAKALGKDPLILYKKDTPEPPTMWRGQRKESWKETKDLTEITWNFIKELIEGGRI